MARLPEGVGARHFDDVSLFRAFAFAGGLRVGREEDSKEKLNKYKELTCGKI